MKNKKLFSIYKEWMETGKMSHTGLCWFFHCLSRENKKYREFFSLINPTSDNFQELHREDFNLAFWASGYKKDYTKEDILRNFTPLRQTIVLFVCAMNNEL